MALQHVSLLSLIALLLPGVSSAPAAANISDLFSSNISTATSDLRRRDVLPQITAQVEKSGILLGKLFSPRTGPACVRDPGSQSSGVETIRTYEYGTTVRLTCWTAINTTPELCRKEPCEVRGSRWFRTMDNCFIEASYLTLQPGISVEEQVKYCPPRLRHKGKLRQQYGSGAYCYSCSALSCPTSYYRSESDRTVELTCWTIGESVRGDEFWWQLRDSSCWMPNEVFDPTAFTGNGHECL